MATVSVIAVTVLTVYLILGFLALARVPDPGSAIRRMLNLTLWPVVAPTAITRRRRRGDREPLPAAAAAAGLVSSAAAPTAPVPTDGPLSPAPAAQAADRWLAWELFVRRLGSG